MKFTIRRVKKVAIKTVNKLNKRFLILELLNLKNSYFFVQLFKDGCFFISFLLIPATLTGFFIASLLKGSPSS